MRKYIKNENKYIEWLENNMNNYGLFYYKDDVDTDFVYCFFKEDDTKFCTFYKSILDTIILGENNPNI